MKRLFIPIGLVVVLVAACAPAAGRPTYLFRNSRKQVIETVVAVAPTVKPPDGYNYFGIDKIGDTYVSLVATPTTGLAVLGALGGTREVEYRVTVTTLKSEASGTTRVAFSAVPYAANSFVDHLIVALDRELTPIQQAKPGAG